MATMSVSNTHHTIRAAHVLPWRNIEFLVSLGSGLLGDKRKRQKLSSTPY